MSLGADILKLVLQLQKNKGIDVEMEIIEKFIFRYLNRIQSMSNTKRLESLKTFSKSDLDQGQTWPSDDTECHNGPSKEMFKDMMGTIILSEPACLKYSDADLHLSHLSS